MKTTRKPTKGPSAEAIAQLADRGEDISRFFNGEGRMVRPIQRVNVDLTAAKLEELDKDLNVSRQKAKASAARIVEIQKRVKPDPQGWTIHDYIDHGRR